MTDTLSINTNIQSTNNSGLSLNDRAQMTEAIFEHIKNSWFDFRERDGELVAHNLDLLASEIQVLKSNEEKRTGEMIRFCLEHELKNDDEGYLDYDDIQIDGRPFNPFLILTYHLDDLNWDSLAQDFTDFVWTHARKAGLA
jgi:hypothetical protein